MPELTLENVLVFTFFAVVVLALNRLDKKVGGLKFTKEASDSKLRRSNSE